MKLIIASALLCLTGIASANVNCTGLYYDQSTTLNPVTFELTRETKLEENTQFFRSIYKNLTYTASINQELNSVSAGISAPNNEQGGSDAVTSKAGINNEGVFEVSGMKAGNIMFPSAYVAIRCEKSLAK